MFQIPSAMRAALVALMVSGCEATEPVDETTLDYRPVRWSITGAIESADAIAEGATLELSLRQGGLVNGSLFMPPSIVGGQGLTAQMAGTWIKRGDTVLFDQNAVTFVSEIAWILTPEALFAADSFDGSFYDVELERVFR